MKSVGKALGYILENTPEITEVVDESYFVFIPQKTSSEVGDKVLVRFYAVEVEPSTPKEGQATVDSYGVMIDIYARNPIKASDAAEAIRDKIDKFQGDVNGVTVREITYEGGGIEPDKLYDIDVVRYFMDFLMTINRTPGTPVVF